MQTLWMAREGDKMAQDIIKPGQDFDRQKYEVKIAIYVDHVSALCRCYRCGGRIGLDLNLPKGVSTSDVSEQYIIDRVIEVADTRHNCPERESSWGDKSVLDKYFPGFMHGWERLKEWQHRDRNKEGHT